MGILEFIIGLFSLALTGAVQHPFICLMEVLFLFISNIIRGDIDAVITVHII